MSSLAFRFKNFTSIGSNIVKNQNRSHSVTVQILKRQAVPVLGIRSIRSTAWAGADSLDKVQQSPKIQELTQKILELNSLEVNQLIFALQVKTRPHRLSFC